MKLYIIATVVFVAAVAAGAGYVVFMAYALFSAIAICGYLASRWSKSLSAVRTCRTYAAEIEEQVAVTIVMCNEGLMPIVWTLVEETLPPEQFPRGGQRMTFSGTKLRAMTLRPKERKTLTYNVAFHRRGYYRIGPLLQETGDLFGFYRKCCVVTEPHYILVYPKIVPLEGWDLASRRPVGEVRLGCRLFEDPTRIAGVRRYVAGDPMNHIHWKATARTGVLHTRLHDPSSVAGITILLDFARESYPIRNEPFRSELAVTAAASVTNAIFEMSQQAGLITNAFDAADLVRDERHKKRRGLEFLSRATARARAEQEDIDARPKPLVLPADKGPAHFQQIWEMLARVKLSEGISFGETIIRESGSIARDATVMAILGEVTPETALALGSLRRSGLAVTAVINTYYDHDFEKSAGMLLAENIEVRKLRDEEAVLTLCQDVALSRV